jgi:hypothetical protein
MLNLALRVSFVGAGLLAVVGCGQDGEPSLSGSVTYNGAPVANGTISFTPIEGESSFGAEVTNGKYAAKDAQPGQYKATIQAHQAVADMPKTREAFTASAGKAQDSSIPADAEGNGRTVEVKGGEQTLDFAITGPPQQ